MTLTFTFVTGSSNKFIEAERILRMPLTRRDMDLPEIQAVKVEDVVEYKAKYAYNALDRKPVMVEDTGLFIDAWNGLPGALIKWFEERMGAAGICQMMRDFEDRSALARSIVATYDGKITTFSGEVRGKIAFSPSGISGFGWDSIFIPEGENRTFADMRSEEKDKYSMRRQALEAMKKHYY